MPELPEVETIANGLRPRLVGRTIERAVVRWPRTVACPPIDIFAKRVVGRSVASVGRRGKYIVLGLDDGWLLIHLKMTGRLLMAPAGDPLDVHTHLILGLDDGFQLWFHDVRKFGRVYLVDDPDEVTAGLGPEPLDPSLSLEQFQHRLALRRGRLKSLLLNQAFLAGIGNIYADEALYMARLHPLRRADSLSREEQTSLYEAIRTVLEQAITRRGTTLDDGGYVDVEGRSGEYQAQIAVYGRTGSPCLCCGSPVERIVVGGRSTHFCPLCQESGWDDRTEDPLERA